MNEEKTSLLLILLIEVEDDWRLLLYDCVLGILELLQLGGGVQLLQLDDRGARGELGVVEGGGQLPHLDVWGSVAVGLLQLEVGGGGDVELR